MLFNVSIVICLRNRWLLFFSLLVAFERDFLCCLYLLRLLCFGTFWCIWTLASLGRRLGSTRSRVRPCTSIVCEYSLSLLQLLRRRVPLDLLVRILHAIPALPHHAPVKCRTHHRISLSFSCILLAAHICHLLPRTLRLIDLHLGHVSISLWQNGCLHGHLALQTSILHSSISCSPVHFFLVV